MGTDRYCSLNAHYRLEQSRRDDLFSFIFMIVELAEGRLPWRSCRNKDIPDAKVGLRRLFRTRYGHRLGEAHPHAPSELPARALGCPRPRPGAPVPQPTRLRAHPCCA